MDLRVINQNQKNQYNKLVTHVVQSWEWGEFRGRLGLPVLRYGIFKKNKLSQVFQLTLHKIPLTPFFVGYLPKGPFPDSEMTQALTEIGKKHRCAFIKIEPNVERRAIDNRQQAVDRKFIPSPKPYFTKYNFVLDLTQSEETILKNMHPKFRYNIKVAQKHGVWIEERTDKEALDIYLKLYFDTTKRQGYLGHNQGYHRLVWEVLQKAGIARLLIAFAKPEGSKQKVPLAAWMLFTFKDTLYYPYGGSSTEYKNLMASNLLAWEAIKLGKKLKMNTFDLWGALGTDAKEDDPWQGFHQFKQKLGGQLIEYAGTYDLVFNWPIYWTFTNIDKVTKIKAFLLKLLGK